MSAKKQSKARRACVDCHFISISQLKWGGHPEFPTSTEDNFEFGFSEREQARKNKEITATTVDGKYTTSLADSEHVLTCYKECWNEFNKNITKKSYSLITQANRYNLIVATDRSDCIYFFKYRPSMSFKAAEEHMDIELLQTKKRVLEGNRMDSNENELATVIPDSDDADKDSVIVYRLCRLLKYKKKEVKIEPLQIKLLDLLYKNRHDLVTRSKILDHIWEGQSGVYDHQVTDHINKIRVAFTGLGYEKDIIKTVNKSRASEGGYIFNSHIVSLDFH